MLALTIGVKAQGHFIIPKVGMNISGSLIYGTRYYPAPYNPYNYIDMSQNKKVIVGLSAGVTYRYEFGNPFLVEVGFYYNQYGYGYKDLYVNGTKTVWNQKFRYHHFSVPIMFGYKFAIGRDGFFLLTPKIGIQMGYYTNMKQQYSYLTLNKEQVDYEQKGAVENGIDIAEVAEIECGWRLTFRYCVFVSVSERYSFRNMFNENDYVGTIYSVEKDSNYVRGDSFNFSFAVNAGLRITLGKKKY